MRAVLYSWLTLLSGNDNAKQEYVRVPISSNKTNARNYKNCYLLLWNPVPGKAFRSLLRPFIGWGSCFTRRVINNTTQHGTRPKTKKSATPSTGAGRLLEFVVVVGERDSLHKDDTSIFYIWYLLRMVTL